MLSFPRLNRNRFWFFDRGINVNDGYSEVLSPQIAIDEFLTLLLLFIVIKQYDGWLTLGIVSLSSIIYYISNIVDILSLSLIGIKKFVVG